MSQVGSSQGSVGVSGVPVRAIGAVVWLAALGALTLTPQPPTRIDPSLPQLSFCVVCGVRGTSDALLNVVLFLPLGLLLHGKRWSWLRVAGVGMALSLSIELAQHFIPGRYSNLGDVLWNTGGAAAGALLASSGARWLPGTSRQAGRLRILAVVGASVVTFGFGWLLEPNWPKEPYWGQWTPDLGWMEQYSGSVVRATLDTIPIPPGRFPARESPRAILSENWTLDATAVKGTPPASLAPIVNVYDGQPREVLLVGALGEDLVFREHSRARLLRLDQPDLRLPGVMAQAAVGDTMHLRVVRRGGDRCLGFDGSTACTTFTPGRAWALLLYPEGVPGWMRTSADTLWALLLLAPVGLWSERRSHLWVYGAATALLMGLAIVATRLAAPPATEVAAAVFGLLTGYAIRFFVVGRRYA